jgi:hypothetical protein
VGTPDGAGHAVVRVLAPGDLAAGAGVLLARNLVATCAHVVSDALGHDDVPALAPGEAIRVDLPFAPGAPVRRAVVWRWWPPGRDGSGDIALLRLDEAVAIPVPATRRLDELWDRPFRAAGFPPGQEDGVWSTGVLRAEQGSGWVQLGEAPEVGPGFSGTPVWDSRAGAVIAMAVAAERTGGPGRAAYALPIGQVLSQAPELVRNPYRGLAAFGEKDRPFFFGREADLDRAVRVLEREGLLILSGGSGAGKSSLLAAGVVPAARARGRRVGRARPTGATTRGEVVTAFAEALAEATTRAPTAPTMPVLGGATVEGWTAREWTRLLVGGTGRTPRSRHRGSPDPARTAATAAAVTRAGLLLVVDQLEDLAAAAPVPARTALELVGLLTSLGVWVALTARRSTVDDLQPGWSGELVRRGTVAVAPLDRDGLRAAVAEPAARVPGPSFDPGVVARIVDDAGDEPGRLPLVAILLAELWDAAEHGRLTMDAYRRVGTVHGALAVAAERTWTAIAPGRRARARTLLLAMTRPSGTGFVRDALPLSSLDTGHRRVIEALAAARLVVITPGPAGDVAELAHQSLIERWPRLQQWLERDGDFLRWHHELGGALARWTRDHDAGSMLRGGQLQAAQAWVEERGADLDAGELAFVHASAARVRREERLRWAAVVVVVVLGVLVGVLAAVLVHTGTTHSGALAPNTPQPPAALAGLHL